MTRRRWLGWTAAAFLALSLVTGAGVVSWLRSNSFRRYVITKIIQQADEATGGRMEVQNIDFRWSTLTVNLYGITLHGTENPAQRPLVQVDRLTLSLRMDSLLHRELRLTELLIEHPVAHLAIDRNGKSNLPEPAPQPGESHSTTVFDLAVRNTTLNNGEIYLNDTRIPIAAAIRDLHTAVQFNLLSSGYTGSLSYANGDVQYGQYAPFPHRLSLQFTATPSSVSLEPLAVTVRSSTIALRAKVTNYSQPKVDGTYDIHIHAEDFDSLSPGVEAEGEVQLSGAIRFATPSAGAAIQGLWLDGRLASDRVQAASRAAEMEVQHVAASYQLAEGRFEVRALVADLLHGRLSAHMTVRHLDRTPQAEVSASVEAIALEALQQVPRNPSVKQLPITGTLAGQTQACWTGSLENLQIASAFSVRGAVRSQTSGVVQMLPAHGAAHVVYDRRKNSFTFSQTSLEAAATSLVIEGQLSDHSNLKIHASASDLGQVALLASAFGPPGSEAPVKVSGSASLDAVVEGPIDNPRLRGEGSAQNLATAGSQWKSAKFAFDADPSRFDLENASLVSGHQGDVAGNLQIGLNRWSYAPSNPLAAHLSVRRMSVADLEHLAGLNYPITGTLVADVSLSGSQLNPTGQGTAEWSGGQVWGEPVEAVAVKFEAGNGSVHTTLKASLPAGNAQADLHFTPKTKTYSFDLEAPAIVLEKLQTVEAKNLELSGTVNARAHGEGTLDNPNLTATVELPSLQLQQTSITGIKAQLNVAAHRANLVLVSEVAQAHVEARGTVDLTPGYHADLSVDLGRTPLRPLLALYYPGVPEGFAGETELHATLHGPLADRSRIEAHVTIPVFSARYQDLQIASAAPIRADFIHSMLTFQPAEFRGTGTSLELSGTVPIGEAPAALNLTAKGSLDLRIVQILWPDIHSSGSVTLEVHTSGTAHEPAVKGQIHVQDVAFSTAAAPLGVEQLKGDLDLDGEKLQIRNLTAQVGGGQVAAGGSVTFGPEPQFNLALEGQSVRLRYPEGVRIVLNSNLALIGTREASAVTGRVLIDSLSFTPDFDLNQFLNQFEGASTPSAGAGFADNMRLEIAVQSTRDLNATSSALNLEGTANLRVTGTAANPVIVGRADMTSGDLFFRSNRYQLEHGLITFSNPVQTEPVVNLAVTTTIEQYNLTVTLKGAPENLRTTYVSDPPLATADVINLIARGQTTEESTGTSTSADSILAGQVAGQFSGGIQKLAGISSLQIDPLIGGNNQNPSARIALQQHVTKNLLFTFSTDVTQPGNEVVQGDYEINRRWSVSVSRDQLGGVSVYGRYRTKF
jgi:translocation and assembly module TamB